MSNESYTFADPHGILADLNDAQRRAVTYEGGPLLVVAGAGTGKTRVLTQRVGWLVSRGVMPWAILAITFTNKAADVLKSRLSMLPGGQDVWAGTFHGFGSFLLRRHGDEVGIDPRFTIADRDDQLSLIKAIYKDLDMDTGVLRPVDAASMISHRKNGGGGRAPVDLRAYGLEDTFDRLFDSYHQRLRTGSLVDFDDLLLEAVRLLQENEELAAMYGERFQHVLVDEYQDTNIVQRDLLRAILGPHGQITVVGDPDQSIYRWRGAAVRNILEFDDDFGGAEEILLEQNYRSTDKILGAAEAVIEQNSERHAKTLFTEREGGQKILVTRCRDGEDEGELAASRIESWRDHGRRLDEIAVFYRVNSLSRGIELALSARGIPYVVVAGTEFFQRREVKDVLAYARLIANPLDEAAFLRVVNTPRRGIGAASLQKLRGAALARGLTLSEAAGQPDVPVSKRARGGLVRFLSLLKKVGAMPRSPVAPILDALIDGSGYGAMLADSADAIDQGRADNIEELVAYAREYDSKEPDGDLQGFLERASLVSDQDGYTGGTGAVSLMSVHAAKGLEFPCVLITGAEMGYFPHVRSLGENAGEEEERRLFYVAMTRAQHELAITHAARRVTYMGDDQRTPSPYLRDIPADLASGDDRAGGYAAAWPRAAEPVRSEYSAPGGYAEAVRETDIGFVVGERVLHPYFGEGLLQAVGGAGEDTRVTVDFDAFGRKQLLLRHARLERVS